jgi:predicted PurR-regulated permease PerM
MKEQNHWSMPVRYLAFGVVFVLLAIGLWYIRSILEPLIIAAFIAYLINPAVNYLIRRTRLSRTGAVNLVYFITLALLIGTPSTLTSLFFDEFTQVATDISNIFDKLIAWLVGLPLIPAIPIDFGQLGNRLTLFRSTLISSLSDQALSFLGKTSLGALWVLVILVGVYYFLSEWPRLRNGFINSFPETYQPELNELYQRLRSIWMNYLRGQLLLMVIVGVVFTIAWTIIGIPGALVLGVIAGFLTLIPDLGPFLAAMLAIGVALLEGSNWSWMPSSSLIVALIVLAVYLVLISIKNFWLRPYIMGRSVRMDEAVVLISIILSTILWGILGALLIVPALASLLIIFDYLRRHILGLPPFPPKEAFILDTPPASVPEKVAAIKSKISKEKG